MEERQSHGRDSRASRRRRDVCLGGLPRRRRRILVEESHGSSFTWRPDKCSRLVCRRKCKERREEKSSWKRRLERGPVNGGSDFVAAPTVIPRSFIPDTSLVSQHLTRPERDAARPGVAGYARRRTLEDAETSLDEPLSSSPKARRPFTCRTRGGRSRAPWRRTPCRHGCPRTRRPCRPTGT